METTTIWGMNNSQQIILRGNFTTQNTWIYDNKYWETYIETTTIWGMNNSQLIILRGYFTTQNTWIYDNKYTSDKNRVS